MNVQLTAPCFEIHVAERLQAVQAGLFEVHKYAAITREALKVNVTFLIKIGTHFLNLEIGHITKTAADGTLMRAWAAELKTFYQAALGEQLSRGTDYFAKTQIITEYTYYVRTAGNPNLGLVIFSL